MKYFSFVRYSLTQEEIDNLQTVICSKKTMKWQALMMKEVKIQKIRHIMFPDCSKINPLLAWPVQDQRTCSQPVRGPRVQDVVTCIRDRKLISVFCIYVVNRSPSSSYFKKRIFVEIKKLLRVILNQLFIVSYIHYIHNSS